MADIELQTFDGTLGPLLFMQGQSGDRIALKVLIAVSETAAPPHLETDEGDQHAPRVLFTWRDLVFLGYDFSLRMGPGAGYTMNGQRYPVFTDYAAGERLGFVSCNGQEHDDRQRPLAQRNALWLRLREQHEARPFHMLLQGGDQIYADEVLDAHPRLQAWRDAEPDDKRPGGTDPADPIVEDLRAAFFTRYLDLLSQPEIAWIMARVPTLAMWDDHDICDGWGSLGASKLDSPVGRAVFSQAREAFLLFQMGVAPDAVPAIGLDPTGVSLSWRVEIAGNTIIAPDLRSERRPSRVMGAHGWDALERALSAHQSGRILLISSVPALGPRLSWVEAVMHLTKRMEKYEDDLRDQWQSRAHRTEWQTFLERLAAVHKNPQTPVTLISGEIHLATRGTLAVAPSPIHQLVASGVSHPAPPRAYARGLGTLARLGESPLRGRPIRLYPLPGRRAVYTAQRNYLVIDCEDGAWRAHWELEDSGTTPPLELGAATA